MRLPPASGINCIGGFTGGAGAPSWSVFTPSHFRPAIALHSSIRLHRSHPVRLSPADTDVKPQSKAFLNGGFIGDPQNWHVHS